MEMEGLQTKKELNILPESSFHFLGYSTIKD